MLYIQYSSFWPRRRCGVLRRASVRQITTMPTINTTMVARIGTSTSGSSHALTHGGSSLSPSALPGNGAIVPVRHVKITNLTFMVVIPSSSNYAYDNNRDDYNQNGGHDWHDQIQVGQNDLERLFGCERSVSDLSDRSNGTWNASLQL